MQTTATRTTKTETITRVITSGEICGTCLVTVTEAHHRKRGEPRMEHQSYLLRPIANQLVGLAVEVEKMGEAELHHVRLHKHSHECDCKWGTYKGHIKPCRHVEMCLQAIQEGLLPAIPVEPQAVASSWIDDEWDNP